MPSGTMSLEMIFAGITIAIQTEKRFEFFSRYLHACRSVWIGLPTFLQEQEKAFNPCLNAEYEPPELLVSHLNVKAGFTLTDPNDPRYQKVDKSRRRFGDVVLHAAATFRNNTNGEDHIDAVIGVVRAIDTYLLVYGLNKTDFDGIQKNYTYAREFVLLYFMLLTIDN